MSQSEPAAMPDKEYRAVLTDREREILSGEADVSEAYRYRVVSRVRNKIEERLVNDVALLDEHHAGLADELRSAVERGSAASVSANAGDGDESDTEETRVDNSEKDGLPPAALDAVDHDDLPETVDVEDAARAYCAVLRHLDDAGGESARAIVEAVMPDHTLGYELPDLPFEEGERYKGTWWRHVIRPALAADPTVEYDDSYNTYDLVDSRESDSSEDGNGDSSG